MTALWSLIVVNLVFDAVIVSWITTKHGWLLARCRVLFRKFKTIEQAFWVCKQMLDHQEVLLTRQAGPGASTRTQWDTIKR